MSQKQSTNKNGGGARGGRILRSIVLIIFTILCEISPARAQVIPPIPTYNPYTTPQPTNTPFYGPTVQPPIWQVTPTPEYLGDCPTTTRDYDRELSFNYVKRCSQCIDREPVIPTLQGGINHLEYQPTNIYGVTPTPITDNPTPTATSTPMFVDLDTHHMHGTSIIDTLTEGQPFLTGQNDVTHQNMHLDSYETIQVPSNYPGVLTKYYVQFDGTFSAVGIGGSGNPYTATLSLRIWCSAISCQIKHNGNTIDLGNGSSYLIWTGSLNLGQGGVLQTGLIDLEISFTSTNNSYRHLTIELGKNAYWQFSHNTYSTIFTWDYDPIDLTPDPVGYCSEWEYADEIEPGPPLITLPDLDIWQGECTNIIPAFQWYRDSSGSYLFNIDLNFPGFAVCPVWVNITPFSVAGIDIPFEIMYLPALVWLLDAILKL